MDGHNMNSKNDDNTSFTLYDKFDSRMMKTSVDESFEKNLNNEVTKTLVVEILGKVGSMKEFMKEQFETLNNRIRSLEEELGKTSWKKVREEEDFRDVTLACEEKQMKTHKPVISDEVLARKTIRKECSETRDFRDVNLACEEKQTEGHKTVQSSDSQTWAKKLFSNQKKERVEVQGNAKIDGEMPVGWRSSDVEFFIRDCSVNTSVTDVREAAVKIAKVNLLEVEKKTKEGATYGSFRIKVRKEDSWLVKKNESWPPGWHVRNFFRNFKVRQETPQEAENKAKLEKIELERVTTRTKLEQIKTKLEKEELATNKVKMENEAFILEKGYVEKEKYEELERQVKEKHEKL